jgi:nicotinamidase-related amidase
MIENLSSNQKAVIVVDMQRDNVGRYCQGIIPSIKLLIQEAREKAIPVIFACDSRYPDDFLFTRLGLPHHNIRGTEGAKVIDELDPKPEDVIVEKRMLSAFFQSDLDFTLRQKGTKTVIVTGVSSPGCILKTALDAFELGYQVIVPADCCASPSAEDHELALKYLERSPMVTLEGTVKEVVARL